MAIRGHQAAYFPIGADRCGLRCTSRCPLLWLPQPRAHTHPNVPALERVFMRFIGMPRLLTILLLVSGLVSIAWSGAASGVAPAPGSHQNIFSTAVPGQ